MIPDDSKTILKNQTPEPQDSGMSAPHFSHGNSSYEGHPNCFDRSLFMKTLVGCEPRLGCGYQQKIWKKSTESLLPGLRKSDMGSPYVPDFRNGLSGGNNHPISGFTGPYLYLVREPPCISDNSPMTNVLLFIGKRFRTSPPRALSARAARA